MNAVIKTGLLVVVITFAIFGLLIAMGVNIDAEKLFVRGGIVLGILFFSSVAICLITKPSGQRSSD